MPWYADGFPPQYDVAANNRKVAPWPQPNGPRVDCRFRQNYGQYLPAPRPSQFFFRMNLDTPPGIVRQNGSVNLLAVSDTLLRGNSGTSPDGYTVIFEIELFEFPVVEPHFGTSGIRYNFILQNDGFPDLYFRQFIARSEDGGLASVPLLQGYVGAVTGLGTEYSNFDPFVFTYISNPIQWNFFTWWPLSECLVLEEDDVGGFAEMNGTDSYVSFPTFFSNHGPRFKAEWEVRPHVDADTSCFVYTGFTSFWSGHSGIGSVRWWNIIINIVPNLVLDEWNQVRMEFNWSIPGSTYTVWINDVLAGSTGAGVRILPMDNIGSVNGFGPGIFDLRNFKLTDGNPIVPRTFIDLPLLVDACDLGVDAQKGTTHNMALPSCP